MRKRIFYNCLIAASFVIGMAFMSSCEGPAGPAGPAGPTGATGADGAKGDTGDTGAAGADGNVTCLDCHSEDNIQMKQEEFHRSAHASGAIAVDYAGGRASCARCHSHEGYLEFARTGDVAADITNPSAWQCKTCHNIHTTFEGADFAFRLGDPVELLANGETVDGENNNTCINCHQARRSYEYYDGETTDITEVEKFLDPADKAVYANASVGPGGSIVTSGDTLIVTFKVPVATHAYISSTHAGPHHGPQGNVWAGFGGDVDGAAFASHAPGCVACHMGPESGHSFWPELDNCQVEGCHSTSKEGALDAFNDRLIDVAHALEAIHAVHIDETWDIEKDGLYGGVHPMYASLERDDFKAWWNFMLLMEDRSKGAHNPVYADELLDSIEATLGL